MKFKRKIDIVVGLILIVGLVGCSIVNIGDNNTSNASIEKQNKIEIYADSYEWTSRCSEPFLIESMNTSVRLSSVYSRSQSNNYSLSAHINIKNLDLNTKQYTLSDINLINESTSSNYTLSSNIFSNSFNIDSGIEKGIGFSAIIPESINDENYALSFTLNDYVVKMHLYETPDILRDNRTVNYYINNTIVNTIVVKDGRTITNEFVYESLDHLYFCNKWYNDNKEIISTSTKITKDVNFYGTVEKNINFMTFSSDTYTFVSKVNHIPSDGILIIPQTDNGKEICISNYAIYNLNVKSIFIPKTTHKIYSGNFTNMPNTKIYYEGTESEWKSLFVMSNDVVTKNVVYNIKAPNFS